MLVERVMKLFFYDNFGKTSKNSYRSSTSIRCFNLSSEIIVFILYIQPFWDDVGSWFYEKEKKNYPPILFIGICCRYGVSPFEYALGESGGSLQLAIVNAQIKWPAGPKPQYPEALHQFVTWMLQSQPSVRPRIDDIIFHVDKLISKFSKWNIIKGIRVRRKGIQPVMYELIIHILATCYKHEFLHKSSKYVWSESSSSSLLQSYIVILFVHVTQIWGKCWILLCFFFFFFFKFFHILK